MKDSDSTVTGTCTAPGYTDDPVMGCYRLYLPPGGSINKEGAVNLCVSDGASLVLIKSEAEHQAFNDVVLPLILNGALYTLLYIRLYI